jgi:hypothetical protein
LWRPALFDNFIGRKRNVDGGVLAVCLWADTALMRCERTAPTITFPDSSRFGLAFGLCWSGCVWDSSSMFGLWAEREL